MKHLKRFEACDEIETEKGYLFFDGTTTGFERTDDRVFPFIVYKDWVVKTGGQGHSHMWISRSKNRDEELIRGRVFLDKKVLSFWGLKRYKGSYKKLFDIINENLDVDIYNGEWRIDVQVENDFHNYGKYFKYQVGEGDVIETFILVPIKEFVSGEYKDNFSFMDDLEKQKIHMMKVGDKNKALKDMGAKPKVRNWKEWQKPFESKIGKLNENPDKIWYKNSYGDDVRVVWDDEDSAAFLFVKDEYIEKWSKVNNNLDVDGLIFGNYSSVHPIILWDSFGDKGGDDMTPRAEDEDFEFVGRLWVTEKIMSFWDYPKDKKTLDWIINQLNNKMIPTLTNAQPIDDTWRIEVLLNPEEQGYDWGVIKNALDVAPESKLIPISDYQGSDNPSEEEYKIHLLNAKDKNKALKNLGAKPKVRNWKEWQKPFECMTFEEFLILENRITDLRLKYKKDLGDDVLYQKLWKADPTENKAYAEWLLKFYKNNREELEKNLKDPTLVLYYMLVKYDNNKGDYNKQITQIKTVDELRQLLDKKDNFDNIESAATDDVIVWMNTLEWIVFQPFKYSFIQRFYQLL